MLEDNNNNINTGVREKHYRHGLLEQETGSTRSLEEIHRYVIYKQEDSSLLLCWKIIN